MSRMAPSRFSSMSVRVETRVRELIMRDVDGDSHDRLWLATVAAQMMESPWWRTVPERDEPAAVSGEIG